LGDQIGGKITLKGNNNSLKVQKNHFCNGTTNAVYLSSEKRSKTFDFPNTVYTIPKPHIWWQDPLLINRPEIPGSYLRQVDI
jgi:hypothetical protein